MNSQIFVYDDKLKTNVCPKSTVESKIVNKSIILMFLSILSMPVNIYPFEGDYKKFSDCDEREESFSDLCLSVYTCAITSLAGGNRWSVLHGHHHQPAVPELL